MINIRVIGILILLCCSIPGIAQVIPNTQTQPSATTQTLNPVPAAYASTSAVNSIRSWDAEMPLLSDTSLSSSLRVIKEVKQTTQYMDGLGRPIQTVAKAISPNGYDMVSSQVYDVYGREQFKYMAYTSPTSDGNLKLDPFNEQNNFLKAVYNPTNDANGEKFFYGQTVFEASPLGRPTASYAPGNSWAGAAAGSSQQYLYNAATDSVVVWNIGFAWGNMPVYGGYYAANKLYKSLVKDEQQHQVVEYKDMQGRVILKKVQLAAAPAAGHTGWLCTYYIYDDLGHLRNVIQPMGTDWLKIHSWVFDATTWANSSVGKGLTFSYEYDARNRMVIKRVPGTGEAWMVYDYRDRLVMTQDSALRLQGKWTYIKYDTLNRPVLTGIWTTTGDINYHQNLAANSVSYPSPASNFTILTQSYYDNYDWVSASGSGLSTILITAYNSNTAYFSTADDNNFPYPRAIIATNIPYGMSTGTKVNVVGTSTYLYGVSFYDDRARIIQTQSINYTGGKDTTTTQYSFNGQVLNSLTCHGKAGTNPQGYLVFNKFTYDAAGRMTQLNKKVGNSSIVTLNKNQFDELGQLKQKNIGLTRTSLTNPAYTTNPVDSIKYNYNVRGWLRGINKDYNNAVPGANGWFGMELNYDFGFTQTQFNGNIAGIKWRNNNDGEQHAYGFSYDAVNRLTKADFTQYTSSSWNITAGMDFSVHAISYDNNGNILTMNQMGIKLASPVIIDDLVYNYNANSNQLNYVTDNANDTSAHLGDFTEINHNTTQDYWYDGNGNMNKDNNKNVANIHYNYLNLPDSITITAKGYIKYVYDASGAKQQKITIDNVAGKKTVITYAGPFVYQNTSAIVASGLDTLQFISMEEGRIRPKNVNRSDTMYYDYFEKDHLGNIRVVLTDELQQDVYPAASLENAAGITTQKAYYNINTADTIGVSRIASWAATTGKNYANNNGNPPYNTDPNTVNTAISAIVYKLNGNTGDKAGLGITLKVMTGDVIDIYGKSFWHSNGVNPTNTYLVSSILTSFIGAFAGTPAVAGSAVHGATAATLENTASPTYTGLNSWLTSVPNPSLATVPKAYINWILFDEQFKPVSSGSGFDLINTTPDAIKNHHSTVSIPKGGYLYVYCSNESNVDVFFDNLQLIDTRGPLLETDNYYPFGLTMAGISSKAAGKIENKFKFNDGTELQNKEFSDGSGLELYSTDYRSYDPQIGRMAQIDPLGEIAFDQSPFAYVNNNPVNYNDPTGLTAEDVNVVPNPPNPPQVLNMPGKMVVTVTPSTPVEDAGTPTTPAPSPSPITSGSSEPGTEPNKSYSFNEYVGKWENDHGTTMTNAQKDILQTGCVGVVSLELGNNRNPTSGMPFTNPNYSSFPAAKAKATEIENDIKVNRSKYSYGPRVLIYAIQFYTTDPKKYLPNKYGEVDMSGWRPPKVGNPTGGYNFNYGWFDNRTNTWWDGTEGGRNMRIYAHRGSLPNYPDFNRMIYCVTTTSVLIK